MITGPCRFNIYLLLALTVVSLCGCQSHKDDKNKLLATFRVHLEADAAEASNSEKVPIYRAAPVDIDVDKDPFLTEAHVASARVLDVLGGFDLQIQLNRQGTWLLQEYSAANPGKHYAIFSQFGEKGKQARWLAAPVFSRLINSGVLQFTPDCSREEADQIAIGLNNLAKKNESNDRW